MDVPRAEVADDLDVEIGIFGGSGFYELFDEAVDVVVDTPYGAPAAPISVGSIAGRRVAFMARHGRQHQYIAHRVPFRANVWAMASLGVRSVLAPCSVGSLQPDLHPGELVVLDQLVDRTNGRGDTFHDVGAGDALPGSTGGIHHQSFADPYDPQLRARLIEAGETIEDLTVHPTGTMVVINGPRFSTRAESIWFRQMGWHVVNMTGYPESILAAEAGLAYAGVALVTDYDAGVDGHEPVTMEAVLAQVRRNIANVQRLITAALPNLP